MCRNRRHAVVALQRCLHVYCALIACLAFAGVASAQPADTGAWESGPHFVKLGTMAGVAQYGRQDWGIVAAELVNPTDHAVKLLVLSQFAGAQDSQFGREYWIPPHARRRSWYPVLPPKSIQRQTQQITLQSLLYDRTDGRDVLLRPPGEQILYEDLLPVYEQPMAMSLVHTFADQGVPGTEHYRSGGEMDDDFSFETAVAMRSTESSFPTRRVSMLRSGNLPPTVESWRALDRIVLADDRVAQDAAGLISLRRWVFEGGRLWVMLDQIDANTLQRLFGDVLECQEIDRIGLTGFTIINNRARKDTKPESRAFDDPVEFVRVAVSGVDVQHTINGWPASFWKDAGKGRILVTTLDARGWVRLRTPGDRAPKQPKATELPSKYVANASLVQLADAFFAPADEASDTIEQLEPMLMEQIGYRIVGRAPVGAILGLYCGGLLVGGIWLMRKQSLERLIWIGPVGVIIASVLLVLLGFRSGRAVPNTTAFTQIVQVIPGSDDVVSNGLLALYNQSQTTKPLGAERGGLFTPDTTGLEGAIMRRVWTDIDAWHWENFPLPSGIRIAGFEYSGKLSEPIVARGTFGPKGFSGQMVGRAFAGLSDAIIMHGLQPGCAVQLDKDGRFSATSADLLDHGEFLKGTLLSDEQRRRQETYRNLFPDIRQDVSAGLQASAATTARKQRYPVSRPALFVWSDPLPMQFTFPESTREIGSALLHIPLVIDRPPIGSEVVIPTTFLSCTDIRGPKAAPGSMATFDSKTGELKSTGANVTWLEFVVPEQLRPISVTGARLDLRANVPFRGLAVVGIEGDKVVPLAPETNHAIGVFRFDLDRAAALGLNPSGGVVLGIQVGEAEPSARSETGGPPNWKIDYARLEVRGKIEPR